MLAAFYERMRSQLIDHATRDYPAIDDNFAIVEMSIGDSLDQDGLSLWVVIEQGGYHRVFEEPLLPGEWDAALAAHAGER